MELEQRVISSGTEKCSNGKKRRQDDGPKHYRRTMRYVAILGMLEQWSIWVSNLLAIFMILEFDWYSQRSFFKCVLSWPGVTRIIFVEKLKTSQRPLRQEIPRNHILDKKIHPQTRLTPRISVWKRIRHCLLSARNENDSSEEEWHNDHANHCQ